MTTPLLDAIDLEVNICGKKLLHTINLRLQAGEQIAIVGANGSGKTTLLKALAGIQPLSAGSVLLNGNLLNRLKRRAIAAQVLYIPNQLQYLTDFTVTEYYQACLATRSGWHNLFSLGDYQKKIVNFLESHKLQGFANRMIASLSTGELRKLLVLTALLIEAPLVLLDEPTSGLDPANTQIIQHLLAQITNTSTRCIVHVTHNLPSDLQYTTRVLSLSCGNLIDEGTPKDFLTEQRLYAIYGVRYSTHIVPDNTLPVLVARN